jgi:hypothetical protein
MSPFGMQTRVVNPHWFNADPDTDLDPAFFLIADPDPVPNADPDTDPAQIEGFDDQKLEKIYCWNFSLYSFNPQKRTSSTSKHENLYFSIFVGHFCPHGSGSESRNLN